MAAAATQPWQPLFAQGVRAALLRWEVFQAALAGSWGGRNTKEKGEWLEETVIGMFAKGTPSASVCYGSPFGFR